MAPGPLDPIIQACLREVEPQRQNVDIACKPFLDDGETATAIGDDNCTLAMDAIRPSRGIQICKNLIEKARDIDHPLGRDS